MAMWLFLILLTCGIFLVFCVIWACQHFHLAGLQYHLKKMSHLHQSTVAPMLAASSGAMATMMQTGRHHL